MLCLTVGCGAEVTDAGGEGGAGGPCEAADVAGLWVVAYDLSDAGICSPGVDDDLELTPTGGGGLAVEYVAASDGTFDPASCSIHASSHLSWDEGGEAWWDDRDLTLTFSGAQGVGTLLFHMSWNCPGTEPIEIPATASRQVE